MGTSNLTKAGPYDLCCIMSITLFAGRRVIRETGKAHVNFQAVFINPTFLLHKFVVV
jgi:hypothetical protein